MQSIAKRNDEIGKSISKESFTNTKTLEGLQKQIQKLNLQSDEKLGEVENIVAIIEDGIIR